MEESLRRRLRTTGLALGALFFLAVLLADYFVDGRHRLGPEVAWVTVVALVCGLLWVHLSRVALKPLERLADAAERMATGAKVDIPGEERGDEIGQLAGSLVWLRRTHEQAVARKDQDYAALWTVIESMAEGIVLLGPDRQVRLANAAFRQIATARGVLTGRPFEETIRAARASAALSDCLSSGQPVLTSYQEPGVTGRTYDVRVAPILAESGAIEVVLVVLHDVTRLEALESVRREFVANVSHELRTPLTSIKGAIETLLDTNDPATREKLLEIARRQASRMEVLVADLTDLSQIETGAVRLDRTEFDLSALIGEIIGQYQSAARERNVKLLQRVEPRLLLCADKRRVEQILVNLIDNGLKFNRPGGELEISGGRRSDGLVLQIRDTGVGIPSEALENVFHRFFRVDGARGIEVPGTGLGLAIVKHLMRLHGGTVELDSELGRGSTFTLRFPLGS